MKGSLSVILFTKLLFLVRSWRWFQELERHLAGDHVEHAIGSKKTVACACKMQECVFPSLQEGSYCLFSA